MAGRELEPHTPCDRLDNGTWLYAAYGRTLVVAAGERLVCHGCGEHLAAVSAAHLARHELTQVGYRDQFGLNRKASLIAPALAQTRATEGRRRYDTNAGVREGLGLGQAMARDGTLVDLGQAAQPAGSRTEQGRRAASRDGASPALRAHRAQKSAAARERWTTRANELGFDSLDDYLADRSAGGATAHQIRAELGCGGSTAEKLLAARPV